MTDPLVPLSFIGSTCDKDEALVVDFNPEEGFALVDASLAGSCCDMADILRSLVALIKCRGTSRLLVLRLIAILEDALADCGRCLAAGRLEGSLSTKLRVLMDLPPSASLPCK